MSDACNEDDEVLILTLLQPRNLSARRQQQALVSTLLPFLEKSHFTSPSLHFYGSIKSDDTEGSNYSDPLVPGLRACTACLVLTRQTEGLIDTQKSSE